MKTKWVLECSGIGAIQKTVAVKKVMDRLANKVNSTGDGHVTVTQNGFRVEVLLDGKEKDIEEFKAHQKGILMSVRLKAADVEGVKTHFEEVD